MGRAPAPPDIQLYRQSAGARPLTCTELTLSSAAKFLFLVVDVEIPGKLLVVLNPVPRLLALPPVPRVALHPAVDDVDGGREAWRDPVPPIL